MQISTKATEDRGICMGFRTRGKTSLRGPGMVPAEISEIVVGCAIFRVFLRLFPLAPPGKGSGRRNEWIKGRKVYVPWGDIRNWRKVKQGCQWDWWSKKLNVCTVGTKGEFYKHIKVVTVSIGLYSDAHLQSWILSNEWKSVFPIPTGSDGIFEKSSKRDTSRERA